MKKEMGMPQSVYGDFAKKEKPRFLQPQEYLDLLAQKKLEQQAETYKKVLEISQALKERGGQALLVGGSVRDLYFGKVSKDFDVEVYGLDPETIEATVQDFGKVSDVGKAFGILKVACGEGMDIDLSLPRTDSKIGVGHRGFEVKADPFMSVAEAAKRRDFTMNALAADPLTGELHDYYGGFDDILARRLRVTDAERFRDDPLRVLRALQFIGRFGLTLEKESAEIIREMAPLLRELPKERIIEEWKKLLLKSQRPSMALMAGLDLGVLAELHPQFPPLKETLQEPEWHPEGDVWMHTLLSVDAAKDISDRENLPADTAWTVMLATLCHDLGKVSTTETNEAGRIISHAHEAAGENPTKDFLDSLGADNATYDKTVKLVVNHLAPALLYVSKQIKKEPLSDGAIRKLAKRIHPATIQELVYVAMADHLGRGPFTDPEIPEQLLLPDGFPAGPWLLDWARQIGIEDSRPADLIQGRDLLALGLKAGKEFGEIISLANELRDECGYNKEMVLSEIASAKQVTQARDNLKSALNKK